jgi:hypothetical protein
MRVHFRNIFLVNGIFQLLYRLLRHIDLLPKLPLKLNGNVSRGIQKLAYTTGATQLSASFMTVQEVQAGSTRPYAQIMSDCCLQISH